MADERNKRRHSEQPPPRKKAPIFKEAARAEQRQAPFSQLGHKRSLTNPPFPVEMEFAIEIVHVGFGFGRIHEYLAIGEKIQGLNCL